MRRHGWVVVLLAGAFPAGNCARAGVYLASDPPLVADKNFEDLVGYLRAVPVPLQDRSTPDSNPLRPHYRERLAALEAMERDGDLGNLDRIDLGALYIRFRRFDDAIRVLEAGDKTHFLILTNLATAFFERGELGRAADYQDQAMKNWPPVWAGWSAREWLWFHHCERLFQRLLRQRLEEQRASAGRTAPVTALDAIFPQFHMPPPDNYEAGPLPLAGEQLPADAIPTLAQLMIWLPLDDRLSWQYAELLNVSGNVIRAYQLMDGLVFGRNWSSVEALRRHRQILKAAIEDRQPWNLEMATVVLWALAPRGFALGMPALGNAAVESGWAAANFEGRRVSAGWKPTISAATTSNADSAAYDGSSSSFGLPSGKELRNLFVGFACGTIFAFLAMLQGRQWLRRRQART